MRHTNHILSATILSVIAILAFGCVFSQPDMVKSGEVSLEKVNAAGVHIMWAQVRQDGDDAVVTGRVVPRGGGARDVSGHVDVVFLDSQGGLAGQMQSDTLRTDAARLFLRGPGRGPRSRRFEIRKKMTIPIGGKVRVIYHLGSHDR